MQKLRFAGLLTLVVVCSYGQDSTKLINRWKLTKYDLLDNVKSSQAYLMADDESVKKFDEQIKLILDSVYYDFRADKVLIYVDIKNNKPTTRIAKWSLNKDEISIIDESNKIYSRQAKVIKLTDNEFIISPIIDGNVGDSKMVFKAQKNL